MPAPARKSWLIGIDSDGCVFDSMGVKQIQHFHPLILRFWHLEALEPEVRAAAEYINLRSPWRGSNRYVALLKTFEALHHWERVRRGGVPLPPVTDLKRWVESGSALDLTGLAAAAESSPELRTVLQWSLAVNQSIQDTMPPIPPFAGVRPVLEFLQDKADLAVISLTPLAALEHEWQQHGLRPLVGGILGQESGSKAAQIRSAMALGSYAPERVMLLGDAPGDQAAAADCGVRFYPILPGQEAASWQALLTEALPAFFDGTYAGARQARQVAAFEALLCEPAPWAV